MMISMWSVRFRTESLTSVCRASSLLFFSWTWYWFICTYILLRTMYSDSTESKVFRLFETSQRGMLRLGGSVSGCCFGSSAFQLAARVRMWNDMMLSSIVFILFLAMLSPSTLYGVSKQSKVHYWTRSIILPRPLITYSSTPYGWTKKDQKDPCQAHWRNDTVPYCTGNTLREHAPWRWLV